MTSSRVVPHVARATVEGGPGRLTAHGHVARAGTVALAAPFDPLGTPEGLCAFWAAPKRSSSTILRGCLAQYPLRLAWYRLQSLQCADRCWLQH
jgi:hypothetical protein